MQHAPRRDAPAAGTRLRRGTTERSQIPVHELESRVALAGDGLAATYFYNPDLTGASARRLDPTINFVWATSPVAGEAGIRADVFSTRWTGKVQPRFSETYTFTTRSDDGVRLWVDGQPLVNNWTRHGATDNSGSITLTAGVQYAIRMEFFQQYGGATAKLSWQSPSEPLAVVPRDALYSGATTGGGDPTPTDPGTTGTSPPYPAPSGRVFYVSPNGSDKASGTSPNSAWQTVARVNRIDFGPGDAVLFQGGARYSGNLAFTAEDAGSAAAPVTVGSYGTGRATLYAGDGAGITVSGAGGYVVRDVNVVGSGASRNRTYGINFYHAQADAKLSFVRVDRVDVGGFHRGVMIWAWGGSAGWRDVRVTESSLHDNADAGLMTYAAAPWANEDVYVGRVRAYNNLGVSGLKQINGSGIVLAAVRRATVERTLAYDNGRYGYNGAGIWTYDSDQVVFQFNESFRNRSDGYADGGGFDFDRNVSNSVMQYNYSHDNDGPGYLFAHSEANDLFSNNTIRYNVTQDDGRRFNAGAIEVWGRAINGHIYNNTVYLRSAPASSPKALWVFNSAIPSNDVDGLYIRNNVFQTAAGVRAVEVGATQLDRSRNLRLEGNAYWSGGAAVDIRWGNAAYTGFAAWRSATGQERVNGADVGMSADPRFTLPGGGGTVNNPDALASLGAYRLGASSPLVDAGLDLSRLFAVNTGGRDYYGTRLYQRGGYDVGAHELL